MTKTLRDMSNRNVKEKNSWREKEKKDVVVTGLLVAIEGQQEQIKSLIETIKELQKN